MSNSNASPSQFSPYAKTEKTWYLDYNLPRDMVAADSDQDYEIPAKYDEQPWRLSYELYGNERLYYIFALLNPDLLGEDPIYNFKSGLVIKVPTPQRIQTYLGTSRNVQ
ncbi:hypothetical protein [Klebsiella phage phiKp_21]|uniref:Uncharacterized protein n=1 Tax=Klebsiella phage vB_KleM_RaK2 TaxID=1147094 RepID=H6X3N7_9CAUD|nr:baseplate wedge subunit [Klebsiella phage vB_KleM_RaK2]YP_010842992.1 baseplate wedge subunit [Klebsiella phage K64-1]QOE32489.1 hypothetical protein CPT_Muenster_317 [Klebsiella phage Muenster]UYL05513.1 hypothetical protein DIDNDMLP_00528 [Klebsiella phage KP13-7]BEH88378.1 hypothetical protein [Klebsiella phage phiKp_21]AFA44353.1 hypothetical protein RaK2_00080 [Klebsiella phage vB_KleM_RaK2]